ncbi:hypothetical protein CSC2_49850 [Clostridium zeae]|uniref:Tetratricopeptide repeat protein n=1 Tax=Clostridium zeae TaxID=2759022 RepID=A0ABQ1EI02_9CLOT|nr:tetratricopeptide repeat protein [Clostridium zeae]GFZ34459.1 hypothetical protein CSC2_49850 [Clostridium zeae]
MELEQRVYEKILSLCELGDSLVDKSNYDEAVSKYLEVLELVPVPKNIWEASTWIYTAIGDTCFLKGDYQKAKDFLYDAVNCPDGLSNPFILLRLGQSLQELGYNEKPKEYLLRSYMLEGHKIFQDEDDKYFNLIIDII